MGFSALRFSFFRGSWSTGSVSCCLLGLWLFSGPVFATAAPTNSLPSFIVETSARLGLPLDSSGLWVQRAGAQEPLLQWNADQAFNPASVAKLATTLAALHELGPHFRWQTEIRAEGNRVGDRLEGNLILIGSGDPGMVSEEHWRMLGALRRSGLRRIEGDIILDHSVYNVLPEDPGRFDGQPLRAYNQPPHALMVNGNSLRFHVFPAEGAPPTVHIVADPPLPDLRIVNRVQPVFQGSCTAWQRGIHFSVERNDAYTAVQFSGEYPVRCGEYSLLRVALPVLNYQEELFRLHWGQWGGEITGTFRYGVAGEVAGSPLLIHESRPLGDLLRVINKWSPNAASRQLALTLGAERFGTPVSLEKARAAILETLAELGVDTEGLWIDNGSGLSRDVRMSPRQVAAILQAGWESPFRHEYISSLAIAGMDGTMRSRFADTPERGRMHLKTGRLNEVSSIAGYVRSQSGEDYWVVILVNDPDAHRGPGVQLQDEILRWVYRR